MTLFSQRFPKPARPELTSVEIRTRRPCVRGIEAGLDGKPLDLTTVPTEQRARLRIAYHAVPLDGIELTLTIAAPGPVQLRLEDRSNGLPSVPGTNISPRPADMMQAPFEMADPTIVTKSFELGG